MAFFYLSITLFNDFMEYIFKQVSYIIKDVTARTVERVACHKK
jgi:hypothetical protein